jgi:uncharacterized protein (TIGR03118 family)
MELFYRKFKPLVLLGVACVLHPDAISAQHYKQTNLVSDTTGAAAVQDPSLVNVWGLSRSSTGPWWVANNGTGTSTLYTGTGQIIPINGNGIVTIPPPKGSPAGTVATPTGTVFNGSADFVLPAPNAKPAAFIFVTEDGTISGWNGGPSAVLAVDNSDKGSGNSAVYKGVTTADINGKRYLYVTNFRAGRIEVYDANFKQVRISNDSFQANSDREGEEDHDGNHIPRGFAPFNIQNIGGSLFVTYAKQDSARHDDESGDGNGFVEIFTPSGRHIRHLQHGPWLNSPWGVVWTPRDFGEFSNTILIGNFGSGRVAVFNGFTYKFIGFVKNPDDSVLTIDGLWSLTFGNGAAAGPSTTLFFSAGTDHESHGLLGTLTAVPTEQDGDEE